MLSLPGDQKRRRPAGYCGAACIEALEGRVLLSTVALPGIEEAGAGLIVVGADRGSAPHVRLVDAATGEQSLALLAYDQRFRGGVRVALADINGDGTPDIITAPGRGGGPHIRIFSGTDGALISEWMAYDENFHGGVWVAAGDINGDGTTQVITGADRRGGPHVRAFEGLTHSVLTEFMAYDQRFRGGVRVAAGDLTADGRHEIITAPGPGRIGVAAPPVGIHRGDDGVLLASFHAYDTRFTRGVFVATGDVNADGRDDIVTGPQGAPLRENELRAFSGADLRIIHSIPLPARSAAGLRVATMDFNGDGHADILTATPHPAGPAIRIFSGADGDELRTFHLADPRLWRALHLDGVGGE